MPGTPGVCAPAWAHSTGTIDLRPVAGVPSDLPSLADRLLVHETAVRYAIAFDERRLDVLESLLTESVTFSYRVGEGPLSSKSGRGTILDWLGGIMQTQADQRRHMLGSTIVERLTADEAVLVTYNTIYSVAENAKLVTTGLYRFRMLKQGCTWKIDEAVEALDRPF